jgi:hypothetical protein
LKQPEIFESLSVWNVSIFDLNDFIAEKYGLARFEGHLEADNDSDHELDVDSEVDDYEEDMIKKALERGWIEMWNIRVIMNDMSRKGWILPGNYLINVSW